MEERKMIKMKKFLALALSAAMTAGILAGCGSDGSTNGGSTGGSTSGNGATITILNSTMEIQEQLEKMAESYGKSKGVNVEVYYSSDTIAAHLSTRYASNEPYTISMRHPSSPPQTAQCSVSYSYRYGSMQDI